jgi:hypothetical protein
MAGRAWTDAERAALQAEYGRTPTAELAARLGRTERAVKFEACRAGCAKKQPTRDPAFVARCVELRAAGLPNEGIARRVRASRSAVRLALARVGLEGLGHSAPAYREQARAKALARKERGLPNPTHARRDRRRATAYGLPPLGPLALRVLLALTTGPKTRRELTEAAGQKWTVSRRSLKTSGGSSIPAQLIRRGLVTLTRKAVGHHGLYALTPLALDLLAQGAAT